MILRAGGIALLAAIAIAGVAVAYAGDMAAAIQNLKAGETYTTDSISMTMHQRDALPGKDGVYRAHSTNGHFELRFPVSFWEATTQTKLVSGATMNQYMVSTGRGVGEQLAAACEEQTDGKSAGDPAGYLETLGTITLRLRSEPFERQGIHGIEFRGVYIRGHQHFAGRAFMARGMFCLLGANFAPYAWDDFPAEAHQFFDSFRLLPINH